MKLRTEQQFTEMVNKYPVCNSICNGLSCTLPKDHKGRHRAEGDTVLIHNIPHARVVASWSNEKNLRLH